MSAVRISSLICVTKSPNSARDLLRRRCQIAQADQQLNGAISGVNALAPADKSKILAILQPVIDAVNQAVTTGVVPIQNQTIKASIMAALTTIQAALATVKAVVG